MTQALTGTKPFTTTGQPTAITVLDLWRWSASSLLDNTARRLVAEFLVASDLGVTDEPRVEWATYDLKTNSGTKVEVKSAAYVQNWHQAKHSPISFPIAPSLQWDPATGQYGKESRRHADVYVFCLLDRKDRATVNPLNLDQWRFFVLATRVLDAKVGDQKRIALKPLLELGRVEAKYGLIGQAIAHVMR